MDHKKDRQEPRDDLLITGERIDQLLRFLPLFDQPGFQASERWVFGQQAADGVLVMPYPIYRSEVVEFFLLAGKPWWSDYGYVPAQAAAMLYDDTLVSTAGLTEIKTMLTYCVRGERFCDGFWGGVLESGDVTRLLRRLQVLRASADS